MTPGQRKVHLITWIIIGPACLMILVAALVNAAFNKAALSPEAASVRAERSTP